MDETTFTTAGTFTQITAAGVDKLDVGALKEQIRFKYTIGGTEAWASVNFNMLAPSWRPY